MLSDGQASTLVPEVEKLLGLPSSLINIGGEAGMHQYVGVTGKTIERPLGWDTPVPLSESYERPVLVPSRFRSWPTQGKRTDEEFVQSADASVQIMEIFGDLSTRNRVKALEWLKDLIAEQDYIANEIAAQVQAERERARLQELDEKIARYLPVGEHRLSGAVLTIARNVVAAKTRREIEEATGSAEMPPKGSAEYDLLLKIFRQHDAFLQEVENTAFVEYLVAAAGPTKIDDLKPGTLAFLRRIVSAADYNELLHVEHDHPFKSQKEWPKVVTVVFRKRKEELWNRMDPAMRSEYQRDE
jgi:hypothetical protein